MKLIIGFLIASILSVPSSGVKEYMLTVKIINLRSAKGIVEIGVYDKPDNFAKVGFALHRVRVKLSSDELIYHFPDLKQGHYAVCIYHDENSNKECDRNFFGFPTEGYAFSNNVKPKWSIPDFEDCSTYLNENKTFVIKMIN